MTDAVLTSAVATARILEGSMRGAMETAGRDLAERDAAQIALRHATALRRSLETWVTDRAIRATMT